MIQSIILVHEFRRLGRLQIGSVLERAADPTKAGDFALSNHGAGSGFHGPGSAASPASRLRSLRGVFLLLAG